jgi:NADH-quinone oxidoreductase subunit L
VDELYDATVISGTMRLARGSWELDARVIDGVVNGTAMGTRGTSFLSGLFDLHVVDGFVNWIASAYDWSSRRLRRMQWGVVQGYALVMMMGFVLVLAAALWLGRGM